MTHKANGFCRMRSQIPLLPSTEFPRPTASWGGTSRFWNRTQEEPAGAPRCGRSANRFPSYLVSPRRSAVRFESGRLRTSRNLATESTTLVRSESSTMTDGTPNVTTVPSLHDLAGVVVEAVFAFTRLAMPDGWFVARLLRLLPVSRGPSIPRAVCLAGRSHPVPLEGYLASSRLHGRRTRPGDATKSSLLRFTTDATGGSKDRETISGGRHVGLSSLPPTLIVGREIGALVVLDMRGPPHAFVFPASLAVDVDPEQIGVAY